MSTSSSSTDPRLLEVGRITKPHGLRGDVVVVLITDRHERLDPGTELQTDRGSLTVVASQLDGSRWLVDFDGIGDREAADEWRGVILRAEPLDDPDEMWVHDLIGCTVVAQDDVERGVIVSVQANPASDLLVLDGGHLVPLTFVVEPPSDGVVRVAVPDGLWDL